MNSGYCEEVAYQSQRLFVLLILCCWKIELAPVFPLIGGSGPASLAWRTWSGAESPGTMLSNCFVLRLIWNNCLSCWMCFCCLLSNRGRMTTSPRQRMQGTHMLWLSLARWGSWGSLMSPDDWIFLKLLFIYFTFATNQLSWILARVNSSLKVRCYYLLI